MSPRISRVEPCCLATMTGPAVLACYPPSVPEHIRIDFHGGRSRRVLADECLELPRLVRHGVPTPSVMDHGDVHVADDGRVAFLRQPDPHVPIGQHREL